MDSFVPVIVSLLNHESNVDIILLATGALTYLCDVLPSSCFALVQFIFNRQLSSTPILQQVAVFTSILWKWPVYTSILHKSQPQPQRILYSRNRSLWRNVQVFRRSWWIQAWWGQPRASSLNASASLYGGLHHMSCGNGPSNLNTTRLVRLLWRTTSWQILK